MVIVFLSIDSAKMKVNIFNYKIVCQGKAIYVFNAVVEKIVCVLMFLFS